jgi:serine phosphatase RsbU (regulator of sigma subunit)
VLGPSGVVHAIVGDVCGHGPDEAALGVSMRVAWRSLVMAGRPSTEVLTVVNEVFTHERYKSNLFTTLCMLSVDPSRRTGTLHLVGHPPPLLITSTEVRELKAPVRTPVVVGNDSRWPSSEVELGDRWTVLMYTDGLIEGRVGTERRRLDVDGLVELVEGAARQGLRDAGLLDHVINAVQDLNGGALDDDMAVVALSHG